MINCPYCGQPVLEGQKFCGSCGKEVQAAVRAIPVANNPPPSEEQSTPYAYPQPSGYGYEPMPPAQPPVAGRMIIIVGAVILAVCCAFACGLLFGFEIIPDIAQFMGIGGAGGAAGPTPRPTFTPTPTSLLPVIHYFFGI